MRFQKILLYRPCSEIKSDSILLPIGIGTLAEQLESNNITYEILDMELGYNISDLLNKITSFGPDLIGGSLLSFMYKKNYSMMHEIKKNFPDIKIVVGGAHVSIFQDRVLRECSAIDYAIIKEGEESFIELIQCKPLEQIKGLYYRDNDNIKFTGDRPPIRDLDRFSYPRYQKFEIDKYTDIIPIYSSRGCPFHCIFCSISKVIGPTYRALSNNILIEQIKFWHEKGYRKIAFIDDYFTCSAKRIFELCELIKKNGLIGMEFMVWDTRADSTNREMMIALKEAGFSTLVVGVESANNRILKVLRKGQTIEQIDQMVKDACELGFTVLLSFMIGSPTETVEDVKRSFKFATKYPIKAASFFNIVPTPYTDLIEFLQRNNYLKVKPEDYLNSIITTMNEPVFETPEISSRQRQWLMKRSKIVVYKIFKNYWLHRLNLKRFGFVGKLMIDIFLNRLIYNWLLNNPGLKKSIKRHLGLNGHDPNESPQKMKI